MKDPRPTPYSWVPDKLKRVVLDEVDRVSKPDWNLFDRCIICFAQSTAAFGPPDEGFDSAPNGKPILISVFDVTTAFDVACQEVGHGFGLDHELGPYFKEYGCPYSVMSAMTSDLTFTRDLDHRLPGVEVETDPQRRVGPYLPTVHLYLNQYKAVDPDGGVQPPQHGDASAGDLRADAGHRPALCAGRGDRTWPSRRTVLAVVPPNVPGGETYFLELRRKDGLYDGGIGNASVIITAAKFSTSGGADADGSTLRIRYLDRFDLEEVQSGFEGDLDYHSFSGHFVLRVTRLEDDFSAVDLTVTGPVAEESFSLTLDTPVANRIPVGTGAWRRRSSLRGRATRSVNTLTRSTPTRRSRSCEHAPADTSSRTTPGIWRMCCSILRQARSPLMCSAARSSATRSARPQCIA